MKTAQQASNRQIVLDAIKHLDHVLPGQAPIHDFVHHNTLHGFQHLPFEQALAAFTALTGIDCYQPAEQFRQYYSEGRINDADLDAALNRHFGDSGGEEVCKWAGQSLTRRQLYRQALLCDLSPATPAQLLWQLRETDLLQGQDSRALWDSVLERLELSLPDLHPEQLLDLSREQAESWLANTDIDRAEQDAMRLMDLFDQVGAGLSLRGLLAALTGVDILEQVRPQLIRFCASLLDEGQAAWRLPQRRELGLYQAWLLTLEHDAEPMFQELDDWKNPPGDWPGDAVDAIVRQLQNAGIPAERWAGYLERLTLELPGWSGLINWRQTHPDYRADEATQPLLADYLAIRLILDNAYLGRLCQATWRCAPRLDKLRACFEKNRAEFTVRQAVFGRQLPEYLQHAGLNLLADNPRSSDEWQILADRIRTWRHSPLAERAGELSVFGHGWRLFRLGQALGLAEA
ncbi:Na-translocating system protein MpsB, partial [Methylomonas sp. SURF-2]